MRIKGIAYDIGTEYLGGQLSRTELSHDVIATDMLEIVINLHCTAVKIFGKDENLLLQAAEIALTSGLDVWLSPRLINAEVDTALAYIEKIAARAEDLRLRFPEREMVFVVANEASVEIKGFIEGDTIYQRIQNSSKSAFFIKKALGFKPAYQKEFLEFLSAAEALVRDRFNGSITYSAGSWEPIEQWTGFDFASVNLYRSSFNRFFFGKTLRKYKSLKLPIAITEFGCCTYQGADKRGATGSAVLDRSFEPPRFKENVRRSEATQSDYLAELLQIFESSKVDATFVFEFYAQQLTYSDHDCADYDKASFSITRSLGTNRWEPKLSFQTVAKFYNEN